MQHPQLKDTHENVTAAFHCGFGFVTAVATISESWHDVESMVDAESDLSFDECGGEDESGGQLNITATDWRKNMPNILKFSQTVEWKERKRKVTDNQEG